MTKLFFLIFAFGLACTHTKFKNLKSNCDEYGSDYSCLEAAKYSFKVSQPKYGTEVLSKGCFIEKKSSYCETFKEVHPNGYKIAERKTTERRNKKICSKMVKEKFAKSENHCLTTSLNENFEDCIDDFESGNLAEGLNLERCIWEKEHPAEAFCERAVKTFGGDFWSCVKIAEERLRREKEEDDDTDEGQPETAEEVDDDSSVRDGPKKTNPKSKNPFAEALKSFGESLSKPKKKYNCNSRNDGAGGIDTSCLEE